MHNTILAKLWLSRFKLVSSRISFKRDTSKHWNNGNVQVCSKEGLQTFQLQKIQKRVKLWFSQSYIDFVRASGTCAIIFF